MESEAKTRGNRREWVKNAAIIFLAVLLVLTFFSNTILNRSLPEVATRDIGSGTIAARIRVTGTVAANQNYEVSIDESRKVRSVMVKAGQEVSTGDVLFVLSDSKSEELENAEDYLRQLEKSYQEKVINSAGSDYAAEKRDIELAQQALTEAQDTLARLEFDTEGYEKAERAAEEAKNALREAQRQAEDLDYKITDAENNVTKAEAAVVRAQEAVSEAQQALSDSGYVRVTQEELDKLNRAKEEAEKKVREADNNLAAAKLIYEKAYNWIHARAEYMMKQTTEYKSLSEREQHVFLEEKRATYEKYVMDLISDGKLFPYDAKPGKIYHGDYVEDGLLPNPEEIARYQKAFDEMSPYGATSKQAALDKAKEAYDDAAAACEKAVTDDQRYALGLQQVQLAKEDVETAKAGVELAREAVEAARKEKLEAERRADDLAEDKTRAEEALEALKDKKSEYDSKAGQARDAAQALSDKLFLLSEKQKADGKTAQLDQLELSDLSGQIERQRQKVEELDTNAAEKEVRAPVSGVVQTVSITAGQTTTPKTAMATIELPDMGYVLTATVPNEQARRVHTGDSASVANMYWGTQIDATLTAVKADPKDPQNSKQLTFSLTGDVTPGSSLTLSVGQKSAEYDFVVPNSALRSDSNGDFILVVVAKNSPLGDRYLATRVNVTKLANDDTLTAVTGALNAGDFVITTSTSPIKNGDRVRLADTQT